MTGEIRAAKIAATTAIAATAITGLFGVVIVDLQQRSARDDLIRGRVAAASTRYINAMLTEEQHATDVIEALRSSFSRRQAQLRVTQLKADLERIKVATSEVDLVNSSAVDSGQPIARYGEVKGQLTDDLQSWLKVHKLEHSLSNVEQAVKSAASAREAFTSAENAALQPRNGFLGLW